MVYRNRPRLLGVFVRPKQQLRMATIIVCATWLVNGALLAFLIYDLDYLSPVWLTAYIFIATTVLSVFTFLTGVVISHRIFGPIVSMKRHIASLREGQYTARLQMRESDDLVELKDALNDLAAALEARHGAGPRLPS